MRYRSLRFAGCAAALCLLIGAILPPSGASAQAGDAAALLELINNLRAGLGLPPYTPEPALMAAAQAHSQWGASVGYFSHEGADGSRPTDRAVAAGYGTYGSVRVSENIYWGSLATPDSAFAWWSNSAIHYAGMTSPNYSDIGIGVAYSDSGGYFTLLFGSRISSPPPAPSEGQPAAPPAGDAPAEPDIPEIATVAPNPDGSIIHVVQEGQAIWNIAAAYGVPVPDLLALNHLTDGSIIHAGNPILVRPPGTPAPTATAAPPPTPTRRPTLTPIAVSEVRAGKDRQEAGIPGSRHPAFSLPAGIHHRLRQILLGFLALGAGMVLVGIAGMSRPRRRHRHEETPVKEEPPADSP